MLTDCNDLLFDLIDMEAPRTAEGMEARLRLLTDTSLERFATFVEISGSYFLSLRERDSFDELRDALTPALPAADVRRILGQFRVAYRHVLVPQYSALLAALEQEAARRHQAFLLRKDRLTQVLLVKGVLQEWIGQPNLRIYVDSFAAAMVVVRGLLLAKPVWSCAPVSATINIGTPIPTSQILQSIGDIATLAHQPS